MDLKHHSDNYECPLTPNENWLDVTVERTRRSTGPVPATDTDKGQPGINRFTTDQS